MSLNETHKNVSKALLLGISSILPKENKEYYLFDDENTVAEAIYDIFETEIEQVTFSLNEEYLKKKDDDIIIEQKASKNLTQCVIVNKIDKYIKKCENSKSFRILWQLCNVYQIDRERIIEADSVLEY
ncbi:3373_t:CDS:2 [Funneliformis mosseae]|uniref:3373_t:CDS:1 n=1 Tax=Funneliformis mosseae TaxID=27381 RepID=A0A9N9EZZ8_FUNMO|nr:3373_t:CDS:2 [Funneliformis mosseae]